MEVLPCIAALLLLSCSLAVQATVPTGTIERVTKQQILASIPPGGHASPPVLFLTSPSGKYAAYFVRTHTVPGAGGLGADFCYVEVTMAGGVKAGEGEGSGGSVWESECRPVSTVNTCTLLFSWHGLEVFDGSEEVWHGETNTDGTNFLQTLELVDDGDMRVRDKDGELAWRASDEGRHGQHCGAPGSPGLNAALPPFAEPIGAHSSNLPFGQVQGGNGHAAELPQAAELGDGVATGVGAGALGDGYGIAPTPGNAVAGAGPLGDGYGIPQTAGPLGDWQSYKTISPELRQPLRKASKYRCWSCNRPPHELQRAAARATNQARRSSGRLAAAAESCKGPPSELQRRIQGAPISSAPCFKRSFGAAAVRHAVLQNADAAERHRLEW